MEGLPLVCYSTGTINSLLAKLTKLKNHSNPTEEFSDLTENFKKAVRSLKEDFCDKLGVPTVCMKQVRELVFEIEDWIDQKLETDMLDPSDTKEIQYFMTEIREAHERFTWYGDLFKEVLTEPGLDVVAPSKITINPRLPIEEKSCRGILDGPRHKIVKHLTEDKEEMRKVVSIVGMEGLGKTTLAKEIYSELQLHRQFECQAFVSAGRRPAMREILNDILCQVKPWSAKLRSYEKAKDVEEIITELQEYFGTKR
uniref:NB-ARC domain-containing protein n=1 Tax=Triticum urartu TaxID=4572 RepID=A0A8R7JUQ4_TRIUA